ncbi:2-acylglycerol O-acyltransferase 3-like, partial [Paramacrobiotus metropolitanus]|uniref:2-acylglycerol O-acyltransferase 3-like n=1 Tax=Paramacrobiotus metropolitanus TaxID=2943436 RepID=UPI0024458880
HWAYPWIRRLAFWKYYRDYFPVKLIKTTELDPRCRYIMGCHPHGIMGCGFWSALATEANGWGTLFPGIDLHLLGMKVIFQFPLYREYCMALGLCDVSRESIEYWMRKAPGTAVGIVVGGAKEAREDDYQNVKLVLKNRKGFVKLAIQTGAHLVPVFSFGENDVYRLYHPDDGSWIDRFQRFVHAKTRLAPVVFFGRGFFNYTMGFLPKRRPITVIIGAPIPTVQNPQPTEEEIDHAHRRYLDDLRDLFDSHKASCGYPNAQLSYID